MFNFFQGNMPTPEGVAIFNAMERDEAISNIIAFLQSNRFASIKDACKAYHISYTTLTKSELYKIRDKAPWAM